jgi:hypothetical protein
VPGADRIAEIKPSAEWSEPRTRDELHAWLREQLGLAVPRKAVTSGNSAPFEYLAHSFFQGRVDDEQKTGASGRDEHRDEIVDCVVWANRGGGKTFLGAVATLLDLVFRPGIEVRILGGSMEQSKRMHAHLRRLFDPRTRPALAALVDGSITQTRLRLVNGSEVELLAQSQTSVRGTRVQRLRCDEVDLFDLDVWEAAQLATRSKMCGNVEVVGAVECLSTMHVPHGVMHDLVRDAREGGRRLFRWGVVDVLEKCGDEHACRSDAGACPLLEECAGSAKERNEQDAGHVSVRDAIALKRRVAKVTWDAEMLCKRPRRSDAVLPEFSHAVHVFGDGVHDPEKHVWLAGMDFGWRAPTVVLWAALDESGVLRVVDERVERGVVLDEHINAIMAGLKRVDTTGIVHGAWPACSWIGVDPAGQNAHEQTGTSSVEIMRAAGLSVKTRRLGVGEGLNLIRARLAPADGSPPRLYVHERCEKLIESLERYHFPTDDPESEVPVKRDGFDHAVDALRYLVQNLDKPYRTRAGNYLA